MAPSGRAFTLVYNSSFIPTSCMANPKQAKQPRLPSHFKAFKHFFYVTKRQGYRITRCVELTALLGSY